MDVINDDAKGGFRRIEVLTGPARRRRWSASEKGRIVAETLQADATVTEVARRWHVCPQQVWGWRRAARAGNLSLPSDIAIAAEPTFVPIITEHTAVTPASSIKAASKPARAAVASSIEIALAGAVVRVAADTDGALLVEVLRAVRASAT
jgi:transposase